MAQTPESPRWISRGISRGIYRFGAAGLALAAFLGMSCLYAFGSRDLYEAILRACGVSPFRFPFVDLSGSLAAWECVRLGVDVVVSDPCDVLHRGYTYSPLWMAGAAIPLGVRDTMAVGWGLDLVFLMSLSLLPAPQRPAELLLVTGATLSTMVVFAVERANPDLLLFMLALAAGPLMAHQLPLRLLGYFLGLAAALLKYYPILVLVMIFREQRRIFLMLSLLILGFLGVFWMEYHGEIARGLPHIARGRYDTDLFGAQNLPFLIGMLAEQLSEPAPFAALVGSIVGLALFAALACAGLAVCRRLLRFAELRAALAALPDRERVLLVIGGTVIAGCFFAGQSIGYRGVFMLLVFPGLLAISRVTPPALRIPAFGTGIVIVLLMWGEGFRLALYRALDRASLPAGLSGSAPMLFWLFRELCWWWTVTVMLTVLADFVRTSPVGSGLDWRRRGGRSRRTPLNVANGARVEGGAPGIAESG